MRDPIFAGKAPGEPWQGDSIALLAAYHRAGLSHWASTSPQQVATAEDTVTAAQEWKPPPPKLAIDCFLEGAAVILPYGCELGTSQRYTELWAKAFTKVELFSLDAFAKTILSMKIADALKSDVAARMTSRTHARYVIQLFCVLPQFQQAWITQRQVDVHFPAQFCQLMLIVSMWPITSDYTCRRSSPI